MRTFSILLITLIALISATTKTEAASAANKAKNARSDSDKQKVDYQTWLRQYGAFDVLQRSLANNTASPSALLERSRALLEMNDAHSVLELIQDRKPFKDKAQEAERLLLVARAHRFMGDMSKSLRAYSQAADILSPESISKTLLAEPSLEDIWRDVWRKWVWEYVSSPESDIATDLRAYIDRTLSQALSLWKKSESWKALSEAWSNYQKDSRSISVPNGFILESVSDKDREIICKFLAHLSLGQWDKAQKRAEGMSTGSQVSFWKAVLVFAQDGQMPEKPLGDDSARLIKADAFLSDILSTQPELAPERWRITEPILPAWSSFSEQLGTAKPSQALDIIERESKSLLLSPDTTQILRQMALAYAVLQGDAQKVHGVWSSLELTGLPVSLRLAGLLTIGNNIHKAKEIGIDSELAEAAGLTAASAIQAPFWVSLDEKGKDFALLEWPLDGLLILGSLKRAWLESPSPEIAKRLGLLFPETPSGIEAILSLAEDSGRSGLLGLSATYLAMVDVQRLAPSARAAYLHSKARLELELGRSDKALETYEELLALDHNRLSTMQKLQLALLAQQRGRLDMASELLDELWSQRATIEPAMQAEILFYQAEVAHSSGSLADALDNYLKLAYLYPEQNIWALTALYRAALLYESAGRYDSAKQLLGTVIKNADRKSQKEAAAERLKAVESKLTTEQHNTDGKLYPF